MAQAELEKEKERRVTHLQSVAARRITQIELSKGWQTWFEAYLAGLRCRQLLAGCAARMAKPKLVACYRAWYHSWDHEMRQDLGRSYEALLKQETSIRKQVAPATDPGLQAAPHASYLRSLHLEASAPPPFLFSL